MLNSIRRVVQIFSPPRNPCALQLNPFSSKTANQNNFTADYLVNKLGFSPETALTASKSLKFKSPEKPDSVIAFLNNNGFNQDQIVTMVRKYPKIISCDPQKTLLPKIEYFRSSGLPQPDVTDLFVLTPRLFGSSLNKLIAPKFDYLKTLFESNGASLKYFKRLPHILRCNFGSILIPNIENLREAGVGYSEILNLLQYQPRAFMVDTGKFREVVTEVKRLGFNPSEFKFVVAVHALRSMTKSSWENKLRVYMKWGWSEDDCISAFIKQPYIMVKSEDYITKVMGLLVNEMGFCSSLVSRSPYVLSYSFEKRLRPRSRVYKFLWENGLKKRRSDCLPSFSQRERDFLRDFVVKYEKEAPELVKMYRRELDISKS
ncbi:hypothetical protein PHJA_000337100 [Phtheirospermum japonicum]|uniref:Uncharacterized protein n=1 Tax=Phtheirospermum japonicum TaxID=374723 RepID=A0A830BA37_9LAMI|nr:hypothetical protein PHJA_000337100 [Phtheirospermum japonicum]